MHDASRQVKLTPEMQTQLDVVLSGDNLDPDYRNQTLYNYMESLKRAHQEQDKKPTGY